MLSIPEARVLRRDSSPGERHPARLAEAGTVAQRITTLQWAVGVFCALLGTLMVVAPHQFSGPLFTALSGHLSWLG